MRLADCNKIIRLEAQVAAHEANLRALLPCQVWTTSPPTGPGWYWARRWQGLDPLEIISFDETRERGVRLAFTLGLRQFFPLSRWSHWLRIDPPAVPK